MKPNQSRRKSANRPRQAPYSPARHYFVLGLFILAAGILIWRAIEQQVFEQDFLKNEANKRHLVEVELTARRGLIMDRHGDVLAMTTPIASIVADPRQLSSQAKELEYLAQAIPMPLPHLRDRLQQNSQRRFVYLQHGLSPKQAQYVLKTAKSQGLKGISAENQVKRYYPTGEVFAHVLGFTNYADIGQEGLEKVHDKTLRGTSGAKLMLRNGKREAIDEDIENIRLPRDGQDLILSLDSRLQHIAYRELKAAVKRHSAIGGSAVLMHVRTGEVLAMVNQPGFNPNDGPSRGSKDGRLRNRALTDSFEPGSTLKPFIVAAALEQGYIEPHALIDTHPGYIRVGASRIADKRNLGMIDLGALLGRSSNVGAAKLALRMDKADIWRLLGQFDFGQSPYLQFPAATPGRLIHHHDWKKIDQANLAFGYGLATSTLQLTNAYAALANQGMYIPATLLKTTQPPRGKRVLSAKTSRLMRHLLQKVVTPDGTAPHAAIPGYQVAGKTGTVKKFMRGAYQDGHYLALFAGFAPVRHPHLAMAVVLDEPRSQQYYGGQVAAPVFARVMGEALRLLNVQPDGPRRTSIRLAQNTRVAE